MLVGFMVGLSALLIGACNDDDELIRDPPPYICEGFVRDSVTLTPLANVRVVFRVTPWTTDSSGYYAAYIGYRVVSGTATFSRSGYDTLHVEIPGQAVVGEANKYIYLLDVFMHQISE